MPETAHKVKIDAVEQYGGKISFCKPTLESRESTLKSVLHKTGALEIHPYNDYRIIAGQGTAALEIINEIKDMDKKQDGHPGTERSRTVHHYFLERKEWK